MTTSTIDPTDSNINKAVRTPTAPATSPANNLAAAAGERNVGRYALAGLPSIATVNSIEVNVYLECVSQAIGEQSYFGLSVTVGGTEYDINPGIIASAGGYAWRTVTIPIADIITAVGSTPSGADWASLRVMVNANAEAAGYGTSELNFSEAYIVMDYSAASGGGGSGHVPGGFIAALGGLLP